jgi:Domain of unknown function (DUF4214)
MSSPTTAMPRLTGLLLAVLTALALVAAAIVAPASAARADDGPDMSKFQRGKIISDRIFFEADAMSEAAIQAFLDKKVPTCAAGFDCLKDYMATTTSRPDDVYCNGYISPGVQEKASRIIWKVAQSCGINPQVILVTLQKENGLITKTAPSSGAYKTAMGYACPDSGSCATKYYGLFNQIWFATRVFQAYLEPGHFTQYQVGKTVTVQYHPKVKNLTCASKTFKIENEATEILYTYTPYTPNGAALKTAYGFGDKCSSYGNRNFFAYFTDWFGSTIMPGDDVSYILALYTDVLGRATAPSDDEIYGQYKYLSGTPTRTDLAAKLFTSTEFRKTYVTSMYVNVLGRTPSAPEVTPWVTRIANGTLKQSDLTATFAATNEFYNNSGGTNETYVTALYQLLLGRAPDATGLASWSAKVSQPKGQSKTALALSHSAEAQRRFAAGLATTYLGRPATATEQSSWVSKMAKTNYFVVAADVVGSTEYQTRAVTRFPQTD